MCLFMVPCAENAGVTSRCVYCFAAVLGEGDALIQWQPSMKLAVTACEQFLRDVWVYEGCLGL